MNNDGNKPGDRSDNHESGDKRSDSTSKKLSKDSSEANAKSYRAALSANPNKTDTLSPDGKSKFALTDNGKPLTNTDQVKLLDELKKASDHGQMIGAGGKLQQPIELSLQHRAAEVSQAEAITQQRPPEVQQQIQQPLEKPVQQKDSSSPVANLFSKGNLYPDGVPPIPAAKVLQGSAGNDSEYGKTRIAYETETKPGISGPVYSANLSSPEVPNREITGQTSNTTSGGGSEASKPIQDRSATEHKSENSEFSQQPGVSNERLAQVGHATQQLLQTASDRFGADKIEKMHINKDDVGRAMSALLLGPDVCQLMGSDQASSFGKRLIVFGVAPMFGAADEAKKQFTERTQDTVHEGATNYLTGTAIGAVLERCHPLVLGTVTIGAGSAFLHDELTSPEHQERNAKVANISSRIDKASNADLLAFSDQTRTMLGPEVYKGAFTVVTGGAGMPGGPGVREAAKEEASHTLAKIDMKAVSENLSRLSQETWDKLAALCGQDKWRLSTQGAGEEGRGSFFAMNSHRGDLPEPNGGRRGPEPTGRAGGVEPSRGPERAEGSKNTTSGEKEQLESNSAKQSLGDKLDPASMKQALAERLPADDKSISEKLNALASREDFAERGKLIGSLLDRMDKSGNPRIPIDLDVIMHPLSLDALKDYSQCANNLSFLERAVGKDFPSKSLPSLRRDLEGRMKDLADAVKIGDGRSTEEAIGKATERIKNGNESIETLHETDSIIFKPGVYEFTLAEVRQKFTDDPKRVHLFEGIMRLAHDLKEAGCETMYLDGSFITRKYGPGDFDACWEPFMPKGKVDNPALLEETDRGNWARKSEYFGDIFPRFTEKYGDRVQKWQYDERTREVKGIIKIDLRKEL